MNPSPSQQNQNQNSSSAISEPLFTVRERTQIEEKSDIKPPLLNESQSLQETYDKLDVRYPCYTCWLFFMLIVSGFFFVYSVVVTWNAFRRYHSTEQRNLLLFVAFTFTAFAQYILEIRAIYTQDLARASLALKIVKVNTCTFLALNAYTAYKLFENNVHFLPSETTAFRKVLLTFCLIVTFILLLLQIFITHFQATKVRDNLAKREAIRAQLRSH